MDAVILERFKTSLQEKYSDREDLTGALFGDRKAIDIYRFMQFEAAGVTYTVENVYVTFLPPPGGYTSYCTEAHVRLNVGSVYYKGLGSAPSWFNPCAGIKWKEGTKGQGMKVEVPGAYKGIITDIMPNRICIINVGSEIPLFIHECQLTEIK